MDLKQYDLQYVRIIDSFGNVIDGLARHDSADYNFHELGRDEECLNICNWLFFEDDIAQISVLEDQGPPYGHFRDAYGRLEEMFFESGFDMVENMLDFEDPETALRMIRFLDHCPESKKEALLEMRGELLDKLQELIGYCDDSTVVQEAGQLKEKLGKL